MMALQEDPSKGGQISDHYEVWSHQGDRCASSDANDRVPAYQTMSAGVASFGHQPGNKVNGTLLFKMDSGLKLINLPSIT